jgi:hypothetical protein
MEKLATVAGTFTFGIIEATGTCAIHLVIGSSRHRDRILFPDPLIDRNGIDPSKLKRRFGPPSSQRRRPGTAANCGHMSLEPKPAQERAASRLRYGGIGRPAAFKEFFNS